MRLLREGCRLMHMQPCNTVGKPSSTCVKTLHALADSRGIREGDWESSYRQPRLCGLQDGKNLFLIAPHIRSET